MTGEKELKLNISNLIYEEKIITPLESLIIPESDDEIRIKNWTLSFLKKGKNLLNLEMITDSSSKIHNLKLKKEFFYDVKNNRKTFEIRKNDRDFKRGVFINFYKICDDYNREISTFTSKRIKYFFDDTKYGLKEGYCILGLEDF